VINDYVWNRSRRQARVAARSLEFGLTDGGSLGAHTGGHRFNPVAARQAAADGGVAFASKGRSAREFALQHLPMRFSGSHEDVDQSRGSATEPPRRRQRLLGLPGP